MECRLVAGYPSWAADYDIVKTTRHGLNTDPNKVVRFLHERMENFLLPTHVLLQVTQSQDIDPEGHIPSGNHQFAGAVWILGHLWNGRKPTDLPRSIDIPDGPSVQLFCKGSGDDRFKRPNEPLFRQT